LNKVATNKKETDKQLKTNGYKKRTKYPYIKIKSNAVRSVEIKLGCKEHKKQGKKFVGKITKRIGSITINLCTVNHTYIFSNFTGVVFDVSVDTFSEQV